MPSSPIGLSETGIIQRWKLLVFYSCIHVSHSVTVRLFKRAQLPVRHQVKWAVFEEPGILHAVSVSVGVAGRRTH